MDNVTHSLIGVAVGHVALKVFERKAPLSRGVGVKNAVVDQEKAALVRSPKFRSLVLWTSILSNNAPDSDVVFPTLMKWLHLGGNDRRLIQLLEHRGFTHTVTAAPVLGLICLGLAWIFCGGSRANNSRDNGKAGELNLSGKNESVSFAQKLSQNKLWWKLWGFAILGVFCHLVADLWNDYGIHPFWPISNHWFYGDFIFIVEPLIWFSILPLAFFESQKLFLRGFVLFLTFLMTGLLFFGPYSSWFSGGILFLALGWEAFAWFWQWRVSRSQVNSEGRWTFASFVPAVGMLGLVLTMFFVSSQMVGKGIRDLIHSEIPDETIVQLGRSPAPANPFCWRTLVASVGPGDRYTVRLATVSLLPEWVDAGRCLEGTDSGHAAPLEKVSLPGVKESTSAAPGSLVTSAAPGMVISWHGEFSRPFHELVQTSKDFCRFEALRHFARAPFWAFSDGEWIGGDLRYDRQAGKSFATFALGEPGDKSVCTQSLPEWDPPIPFP
jgi:inner membrane protein